MPKVQIVGGRVIPVNNDFAGNVSESYETVSTIYAMVKIMSDKVSTIPWYMYRVGASDRKRLVSIKNYSPHNQLRKSLILKSMEEVSDHPFLSLIANPNSWQSRGEFIRQFFGYRYITGNTYCRINSGQPPGVQLSGLRPVELQVLPSQYMDIVCGSGPWDVMGYRLNRGVVVDFDSSEIIHWRYPNFSFDPVSKDHLYGMSPLKAATMDITAAKYLKRAQASQAQNEGAKGILVRNDDIEMTEEQRDHLQDRADSELNGALNKGRVVITNANVRWEQLGMSASDLELVRMFQMGKEDIANIYNFPIHLISSVASTFNNVDTHVKYLTTNTIMGDLVDFRDLMNLLIQRFYGDGWWYDFDITDLPELSEDMNKQAQSLKDLYWVTPNEKRAVMKWEELSDPNMDKIYMPSGYVPIERVAEDPYDAQMVAIQNSTVDSYTNGEQERTNGR